MSRATHGILVAGLQAGLDFYRFNYFGVTGREVNPGWGASEATSLRQIGSPETLRGLTKCYKPDPGIAVACVGYT